MTLSKTISRQLGRLIVVGVFATSGCSKHSGAQAEAGSTATAGVTRVAVGKPLRKSLVLQTTQPARIEAFEETPLFAKLAGYVEKVHVDIGDRVKQGAVLITLAIPELKDDVEQKKALLAQANAEISQATSNIVAAEAAAETAVSRIAEAEGAIGRATGEYERAAAELVRIERLASGGSVTEKLVDEARSAQHSAESDLEIARAGVRSAEAAAKAADANVRKAKADEEAARARLQVAEADLHRAETMLGYSQIRSPFDGVIASRFVHTGHFVQPAGGTGARQLMVVTSADMVRVFVDVPELESGKVDKGDPVALNVQASGGQIMSAVTRTSWSLDNTNRALRVEIDVDNANSQLRPGMFATAVITLEKKENALVLPVPAIVRSANETRCCRVEDGKIRFQKLELGLRSGQEIEVLSGLEDGSFVVLTQADQLKDGQLVQPFEPTK
jgi:RND family efflux transporter MFP subunit